MHRSWFKLYHENNCIKKIKTNLESFATRGDNGSFHDIILLISTGRTFNCIVSKLNEFQVNALIVG